jgi:isopenicillin-N epimerase
MDQAMVRTFGLDPQVRHLNHGAFGVAPVAVRAVAEDWRAQADRNPHRFYNTELRGLVAAARARAADFLGIDASAGALVRNVSEGVSAVLVSIELEAGDEMVVCNHGYGAVAMALQHWAGRRGATVREAVFPIGAEDDEIVAAYTAVAGPRTRLVVVDMITSPTASVLPVAAIAAAVDAPIFVDAAHVPGTLPTDIETLGAAYWIGNLHKWAYTPRGSAMLWTREDLRPVTHPTVLSWQLLDGYPKSFDHPGTGDLAGWLAIGAGLDFWSDIGGWDHVDRRSTMIEQAQKYLADALGTSLDGMPAVPAPTMRLVRLPERLKINSRAPAEAFYETLSGRYRIEVPTTIFQGQPYLRLAAAPYNTPEDYERVADAVLSILR